MNWPLAIDRNREALLTIIVALMASLGLGDGGRLKSLPFFLYHKALRIIRPAEAALRRLIMIAAHEMSLRGIKPVQQKKARTTFTNFMLLNPQSAAHVPSFNLIDPLKIFSDETLDFAISGQSNWNSTAKFQASNQRSYEAFIPAASLVRRLMALKNALDNVPKQAKRLARWYQQRDQVRQEKKPHRHSPMRPGLPVGYRKHRPNEIEAVLLECHSLAVYARDTHESS